MLEVVILKPAVENGGFQDDRCLFKFVSIFVGNGQSFELASSCNAPNDLDDFFEADNVIFLFIV